MFCVKPFVTCEQTNRHISGFIMRRRFNFNSVFFSARRLQHNYTRLWTEFATCSDRQSRIANQCTDSRRKRRPQLSGRPWQHKRSITLHITIDAEHFSWATPFAECAQSQLCKQLINSFKKKIDLTKTIEYDRAYCRCCNHHRRL